MSNLKSGRYFATQVHHARMPSRSSRALLPALLRESYAFRELDEAGRAWSKKNYAAGYTSYASITDLPRRSPRFGELARWIDQQAFKFARSLEWKVKARDLSMSSCWINMMGPLSHHSFHLHPLSVISGTFYLKTPPKGGGITFEDPRLPMFMGAPLRTTHITLRPKAGDLILFESWLKHEVPTNQDQADRVSVSFNYDWVRT